MFAFIIAMLLLVITPGPGVLTTAGVGSGFGFKPGIRYMFGLLVGTNIVSLAVVTGVASIVFSIPWLRAVMVVLSALYLLYLAGRIAFSGSRIAFIEAAKPPGILDGVILQLINPKAYVVATTLFSGFPFAGQSLLLETALKFFIYNIIWIPIHVLWLWAGVSLKKLALGEKQQRAINIFMAACLLVVVVLAILSAPATQVSAAQ